MSAALDRLRAGAQKNPTRILFPESDDPRIRAAARRFGAEGLGTAILLSGPENPAPSVEIFRRRPDCGQWLEQCVEDYRKLHAMKDKTVHNARRELTSPLLLAATLVRAGYADAAVSGSRATTAEVVRAGLQGIGLAKRSRLLSSIVLMDLADRTITYADCGVVPDPTAEELAAIAVESAMNHRHLVGEEPRVALLSFSTKGSARHRRVDKVIEAVAIARQLCPNMLIDGELQFDTAFVPEVARLKQCISGVAGQANVFIFPDLDSGNIAYKITERIGGAQAVGPILQGLAKPWMDVSRGCTTDCILGAAVVAARMTLA